MSDIHPTAVISPEAKIAAGVRIGPYAIIEGPVTIGPACIIHPHAQLLGPLTMGARNIIHGNAVLGGWPQDRKFKGGGPNGEGGDYSQVIIGDDNMIREGVTIHRGTGHNTKTVIGSRCFFMVNSHIGHNCVVADDVMLVNGAALGGHVTVAPRAIVGAYSAIHQFCRVGRLAMVSNESGHNVDIPPFFIAMEINRVTQLNVVGMRRAGIPRDSISALRRLVQILRKGRLTRAAYARLPADLLAIPEVQEWKDFCLESKRGVAIFKAWSARRGADDGETESRAMEPKS